MRICPYCGKPAEDGSRFCGNCGASIPAPAPQAAAQEMIFCPNCGERIPANSAFCPNCGVSFWSAPAQTPQQPTPQQPFGQQPTGQWQTGQQPYGQPYGQQQTGQWQTAQQPMGQQMKVQKPAAGSGKKPLIIGIAAAAVAVIALVAVALKVIPGLSSTPAQQFISYQEELFMNELLSGLEGGVDRYGSGSFSTDLTITASVDDPDINNYLANSSINLGVDLGKDSMIASGELVLMGSSILSGTATYDNGQFGFLLPQVDDTYYVMDLEKVIKNLTGEDIDLDSAQRPEISGKQWRALAEAYLDIVCATVTDKNVTMEKGKSVSLPGLGGSFTGTVYTFTPTAEDIENMFLRLADRLENDKDLRELIMQMVGAETMMELMDGYGSYGYSVEDELDEALLELAGDLRREAARIGRDVEDSGFTWSLAVEGKNVRQIRISVQNGNAFAYEAEGTESGGRTELIYAVSYGDRQNLVERSYTKKGDTYEGRVLITIPYEDSITVNYEMDRSKTSVFGIPYGEYRISVPSEDVSISLKVADGANGGVDHTFTVSADSYYFDYMFSRLSLTVNATDRSTVSKPSQRPVDISDYSEAEFYDLFYNIGYMLEYNLIYNSPFYYGW